ncbi:MAG: hypothetical protein A2360_04850 [Candidatus Staskawiczbacteria bacterium RIFOXYB1_FULL_32_11]|uniref:Uncharacterized protein n=1 Tax=Candidatus Staskawiczbacteria bacterium RIFOXYD1_FULL_32_13 TaxID=1802234 RepID=A0A1G2JMH7_9BACT|nr:MAG: hypothetical protein UR22_C0001G0022 [Parcubacteria group bacterium GW2011_GWC2_32_10]OGZ79746.1 MAG: hypothetical protein A2360_04850 [Candidatus Staskawiczbacteria bacterium RIFOXYB1_FULL_32_11]OGZ81035.1 MAG: hypothetical protein A2256_04260 [Candidatus Staskawiczbacteria bacterium RIFOXYA2_FULL_32_7]OGZ87661.1 MAG: hypothetical protein A2561_03110 [Candidatus Staskawiczbacteria bacterium RIFOXYD1_FULL_32_13]
MPKFNPDNLNIHELAIEEPEKQVELPFDPERDITDRDRENWRKLVRTKINSKNFIETAKCISKMNALGVELDLSGKDVLGLRKEDLVKAYDDLTDSFENGNVINASTDAGAQFISLINSVGRLIGKKDIKHPFPDSMQKKIDENSKYGYLDGIMLIAEEMKEGGYEPQISDKDKQAIVELVQSLEESVPDGGDKRLIVAGGFAMAKVLGLPVKPSEANWDEFKKGAESYKPTEVNLSKISSDRNSDKLLEMYYNMAIISADGIKIPDGGGIELVHRKKILQTEAPQMPEQKQF